MATNLHGRSAGVYWSFPSPLFAASRFSRKEREELQPEKNGTPIAIGLGNAGGTVPVHRSKFVASPAADVR